MSGVELVEDETDSEGIYVAVPHDVPISKKRNSSVSPVPVDETEDASVDGQNRDGVHASTDKSRQWRSD